MKKLILLTSCYLTLMACAKLHNNPTQDLYINIKTPSMQDLNFNKEGKLPQDIENEKYYDVNISGSAIKNCEVIDYCDIQIKSPGHNKIFIGDASDWDIVRIDCRKDQGEGKTKQEYDLNIEVYSPENTYKKSTKVIHE